jgi:uncharacterized protein (DUF1810 family)
VTDRDDPFHLQRFVDAQAPIYRRALNELRRGKKESHWMWFIFPQLQGLGYSAMAQKFAISSLAEAAAYLAHPVLGPRLRECTQAVNDLRGESIDEIFGYPDYLKFKSSMTLFAEATQDNELFVNALKIHFQRAPSLK